MVARFELTPAGLQVERALAQGFDVAAYNIYFANLADDVAMVDGDEPWEPSVWPEWHQMIQARIGDGPALPEDEDDGVAGWLIRNDRGEVVGSR